jgi:hypothetical protein
MGKAQRAENCRPRRVELKPEEEVEEGGKRALAHNRADQTFSIAHCPVRLYFKRGGGRTQGPEGSAANPTPETACITGSLAVVDAGLVTNLGAAGLAVATGADRPEAQRS